MEQVRIIPDFAAGTGRPIVLSIAGMDPSGGAGLLADIKTFEQSGVYGLGINTGNTIQTDRAFFGVEWTSLDFIQQSLVALADRFEIAAIKIGILPTIGRLSGLINLLKDNCPQAKIVWDPVLQSSTHFSFMDQSYWSDKEVIMLQEILRNITLLTPNLSEAAALAGAFNLKVNSSGLAAGTAAVDLVGERISDYCPVLIKGGHRLDGKGTDLLYLGKNYQEENAYINQQGRKYEVHCEPLAGDCEKHGSGCVLSAAVSAGLARGLSLVAACEAAKQYTSRFLLSTQTLLGIHV